MLAIVALVALGARISAGTVEAIEAPACKCVEMNKVHVLIHLNIHDIRLVVEAAWRAEQI
jgi:hypothetical protein